MRTQIKKGKSYKRRNWSEESNCRAPRWIKSRPFEKPKLAISNLKKRFFELSLG
jgi:hypothetical protein